MNSQYISSARSLALSLLVLVLAFSSNASANNVTVGCAGAAGVFDFNSLQSALNALHAISNRNHQITLSGTCTETANITDFENLRLIGTPGATLVDPGPGGPGDPNAVLVVQLSKNVFVQGITLQGLGSTGGTLSIVFDSTSVNFDQCTFQNAGAGIFLNQGSFVNVSESVIQNNGLGIRVSGSVMTVGAPGGGPAQTYLQNNGTGIQVDENAQMNVYTTTTIQNNSGVGINVTGGRLRLCCAGNIQILNNFRGIAVNYGSVDMIGPVVVQGNTVSGVLLNGSQASIGGGQTIQQNGSAGRLSGGIIARGNSHLDLFSSQIVNNTGSGVVLRDNSSARIFDNTISGNSGGGVTLLILSSAAITGTITGNAGVDLSCSPDSFAYGDDSLVGKKFCSRFSVEPIEGPNP
jgi:parallel beta helix pectate lyase-like protein